MQQVGKKAPPFPHDVANSKRLHQYANNVGDNRRECLRGLELGYAGLYGQAKGIVYRFFEHCKL